MDIPRAISSCGKICWLMAASASPPSSLVPLGKVIATGLVNSAAPVAATRVSYDSEARAVGRPLASHKRRTARSSRNVMGAKRSSMAAWG